MLGSFQTRPNPKLRQVARHGRALVEMGRGPELGELFVAEFGGGMDAARRSALSLGVVEIVPAGHFLHFERPEILDTYASFLTADAMQVGSSDAVQPVLAR